MFEQPGVLGENATLLRQHVNDLGHLRFDACEPLGRLALVSEMASFELRMSAIIFRQAGDELRLGIDQMRHGLGQRSMAVSGSSLSSPSLAPASRKSGRQ